MEREIRTFDMLFEVETREDAPPRIVGHAAVFNQYTDIGWFEERVMPGAFMDSIAQDDVRALFNHDPNYVLGRNKAGTLKLYEDERGLAIEIDPPDTQFARDLMVSMKRGDITQMSFGFETLEHRWIRGKEDESDKRDLLKVKLWDISPVTFPAYENTDVAVRSHDAWKKEQDQIQAPKTTTVRRRKLDLLERMEVTSK